MKIHKHFIFFMEHYTDDSTQEWPQISMESRDDKKWRGTASPPICVLHEDKYETDNN